MDRIRPPGRNRLLVMLAGIAAIVAGPAVHAQGSALPLSVRDSFPLGSGGSTLCQVQSRSADIAVKGPFDRAWAIVCRDSALPVGHVFALRGADAEGRLAARRAGEVECPSLDASSCRWKEPGLDYTVERAQRGKVLWVVEGFTAYKSALDLALKSLIADRVVAGDVSVATTSIADSEAYARIQAMTLDPGVALAEGYRRNNSGDYADAAAYFETLDQRQASEAGGVDRAEYLVNAALQRSNLNQFGEAGRLFAEAAALPAGSAVVERLRRNYEAIHRINQGDYAGAIARLAQPLRMQSAMGSEVLRERLELTPALAARINAADPKSRALGISDDLKLSAEERAAILDGQAQALKGTAQRLSGDLASARAELAQALDRAVAVRNGRVTSIVRLRAQVLSELARIDEARGEFGSAEALLRSAREIVAVQYPETRSYAVTEAELAAFLIRRGRTDEALALYRAVVERSAERRDPLSGLSRQMVPYFDLLTARMDADPKASGEFFAASQMLVRPGVAETQAVLARELSGGDDAAARLFRQSVSLTRSVERARMQQAALSRLDDAAMRTAELAALQTQIDELEAQQRATIVGLNAFPRYRAVSGGSLTEEELKSKLKEGEAYVKIAVLGQRVYVYSAGQGGARAYRASLTADELERAVNALRNSISRYDGENFVTEPFKVDLARALFGALLGPAQDQLLRATHVVFEPDGAMLKLPINLLVADDLSVARYEAAQQRADADPYDVTMVEWVGKTRLISTAVSARAFMDARDLPGSTAPSAYLGMGKNLQVSPAVARSAGVRSATADAELGCQWPLEVWNNPISDAELIEARSLVGAQRSDLMTGAAFTDTAIKARGDLDRFRILHFATHGLVTPPENGCPVRPALLTSFGPAGQSDGLLTFGEIFDLKLDADMVILSACDTAGEADVQATREAGVVTGGGSALDGLVRAFIGAGGRAVLASHWPAPDDFDATERLITGLFSAGIGVPTGEALLAAERRLMADPQTSHPYYWAGFAVIGDATRPLVQTQSAALELKLVSATAGSR